MAEGDREIKIGVISDTHDLLRQEVVERLQDCDEIIHCGDISSPGILDAVKEIGNADKNWGEVLPFLPTPVLMRMG